mgnify:CR=1 FL=1
MWKYAYQVPEIKNKSDCYIRIVKMRRMISCACTPSDDSQV